MQYETKFYSQGKGMDMGKAKEKGKNDRTSYGACTYVPHQILQVCLSHGTPALSLFDTRGRWILVPPHPASEVLEGPHPAWDLWLRSRQDRQWWTYGKYSQDQIQLLPLKSRNSMKMIQVINKILIIFKLD